MTPSEYHYKFKLYEDSLLILRNNLIADVVRLATAYPNAVVREGVSTSVKGESLLDVETVKCFENNQLIKFLDAIQHHIILLDDRRQLELFN
jgi:hypothetical protein